MRKAISIGTVLLLVLTVIMSSFTVIETGYTGVRSTFGQISEATVPNGFNWKVPFVQSIEKVNNKQQDILFSDEIQSETIDRTTISFNDVTVTYKINPEKSAYIYANVADYKKNLVTSELVASAVKASSKTLSDVDATNRAIIEPLARDVIQESLNDKYGEEVVIVSKVTISNVDFEDSYNEKIAEKQNAQLEYEKQQIENAKNIEKAKADAEAKITKAQAEADANDILEKSLSEDILKQLIINKWNGELPKVVSDGNSMLDISGMLMSEE